MTLVALGALAVGCGSGPGAAYVVEDDDEIPESADAPPSSEDAPPASSDDAPPANPDAPGAGSEPGGNPTDPNDPEALCDAICDSLGGSSCSEANGALGVIVSQACGQDCKLTAAQRMCEDQVTKLLQCVAGIDGLCTDAGDENACRGQIEAFGTCQANNQPDNPDDPDPNDACAEATGACEQCLCAAGTNLEAIAACAPSCM